MPVKETTEETIKYIIEKLKPTSDFINKTLKIENKSAQLIYIKSVVNGSDLQNYLIKPFFEMSSNGHFKDYLQSLPQQQEIQSNENILLNITKGSILFVIEEELILLDIKKVNTNVILETNMEPTIQGPELALSEDIQTNINLIRQRYHESSLSIEIHQVGKKSHQSLAVIYDQDTVNRAVLDNISKKIKEFQHDIILSTAELQILLNDRKYSLMPTMIITERTDRIVQNLAGGKIILLLDGNPVAIIAPVIFFDFMVSMEDKYHHYWISKFSKGLRYFGLFVCLTLPGMYVAFTSYNPEVLRSELALSMAGSRIGVPFPSFIEVLFLLIFMEMLTEASIRLPKAVSSTATTVGGLILGTAATEAALTSNIMVIIVSAVAVSTFAIPINEMSFAIRIIRYLILLFSIIAGLTGLVLSLLGFILYLSNMDSFGEPYLKIYVQKKKVETKGAKT